MFDAFAHVPLSDAHDDEFEDFDRCDHCGDPFDDDDTEFNGGLVVTFDGDREVWLHGGCVPRWRDDELSNLVDRIGGPWTPLRDRIK